MDAKAVLTSMLAEADIRVGGDRPWDIRVHNEGLYKRAASGGGRSERARPISRAGGTATGWM